MISDFAMGVLQSGASIVTATSDERSVPDAGRSFGIRVHPDRESVTIYFVNEASRRTLDNLRRNGRVAITLARPTDNESIQLKGSALAIREELAQGELELQRTWLAMFAEEAVAVGASPIAMNQIQIGRTTAVDVKVESLYLQTPGPNAGERL